MVRGSGKPLASQATYQYMDGHGVADYVEACVEAFSLGHDVGFVRTSVKSHGLKLKEEGAHQSTSIPIRAVRIGLQHYHRTSETRTDNPSWMKARFSLQDIQSHTEVIRKGIRVVDGDFNLSGGGRVARYVDTIPATTSFSMLKHVAQLAEILLDKPTLIVAPPYGGVALGIFLGMFWKVDIAVPFRSDCNCHGLVEMLNADSTEMPLLAVDDYFSTGNTLARVLHGLIPDYGVFTICRTDSVPHKKNVTSLFCNTSGDIQLDGELEVRLLGNR